MWKKIILVNMLSGFMVACGGGDDDDDAGSASTDAVVTNVQEVSSSSDSLPGIWFIETRASVEYQNGMGTYNDVYTGTFQDVVFIFPGETDDIYRVYGCDDSIDFDILEVSGNTAIYSSFIEYTLAVNRSTNMSGTITVDDDNFVASGNSTWKKVADLPGSLEDYEDFGFTIGEVSYSITETVDDEVTTGTNEISCFNTGRSSGTETVNGVANDYQGKTYIDLETNSGYMYIESVDTSTLYPQGATWVEFYETFNNSFDNYVDPQGVYTLSSGSPFTVDVSAETTTSTIAASIEIDFTNAAILDF